MKIPILRQQKIREASTHPIDDDQFARKVLTSFGREEHGYACEIARFGPTSCGDALRDLAQPGRVVEQGFVPVMMEKQKVRS